MIVILLWSFFKGFKDDLLFFMPKTAHFLVFSSYGESTVIYTCVKIKFGDSPRKLNLPETTLREN